MDPGIYYNISEQEYRSWPHVSQSTLKKFMACPRKWHLSEPKPPTPNMIFGSLTDAMWLSGETSKYVVQPSVYLTTGMKCPVCRSVTDSKKCAKCKCDRVESEVEQPWSGSSNTCREWAARQEAEGKTVVSRDMWTSASKACERLNSIPEIKVHRERCTPQVAVVGELCGVMCKGLIDMVPEKEYRDNLGDLKTAPSADPKDWARYVFNMKLHIQAALYLDLWNQASGENVQWFYHFIAENEAPFEPNYLPLSPAFIDLGRRDYQRALRLWGDAQEKNEFPGYEMNVETQVENWMIR